MWKRLSVLLAVACLTLLLVLPTAAACIAFSWFEKGILTQYVMENVGHRTSLLEIIVYNEIGFDATS